MSAVSYFYQLRGLVSPSTGPVVRMYLRGLKRRQLETGSSIRRAKPLTKENMMCVVDYLMTGDRSLRDWRTVWRMNLAFYGWDDVSRLLVSSIVEFIRKKCVGFSNHMHCLLLSFQVSDFILNNDGGLPCFDFVLKGGKTLMHEKNLHP